MLPSTQTTFRATLAAYQRDLARSILPILTIFLVLAGLGAFVYSHFQDRLPSTGATKTILVFVVAIALSQIPMSYFRRAVRRLSAAHGLVCASCGAALGFHYSTLKKTGKCTVCDSQFPGAV
jgi:hypothetical protein